jgi:hypothetical protein
MQEEVVLHRNYWNTCQKFDCLSTNGNYNVRQLSLGSHLTTNLSENF